MRALILLLLMVCNGPFCFAGANEIFAKLLKQEQRPTIEQFEKAMNEAYGNNWPKQNPFGGQGTSFSRPELASIIANFERVYPGATFLPLGRDVALLGDILDAFYRSIGQPDRIRRLDASGTSFPHYRNANEETAKADRKILYGFLKTNGLDFEHLNEKFPTIIFDVTSYNSTSQCRQLIRAGYETYAALGKKPQDLYGRFNVLAIPMGFSGANSLRPYTDVEKVKAQEGAKVTARGPENPFFLPVGSNLTYTAAWHPMFSQFVEREDGQVVTEIPKNFQARYEQPERERVLSQLFGLLTVVRDSSFVNLVEKSAKSIGFEFPLTRTEKITYTERPKEEVITYKTVGGSGKGIDGFLGSFISRVSVEGNANHLILEFLEDFIGMWKRGTVYNLDRERVFEKFGAYTKLTVQFRTDLMDLIRENPGFFNTNWTKLIGNTERLNKFFKPSDIAELRGLSTWPGGSSTSLTWAPEVKKDTQSLSQLEQNQLLDAALPRYKGLVTFFKESLKDLSPKDTPFWILNYLNDFPYLLNKQSRISVLTYLLAASEFTDIHDVNFASRIQTMAKGHMDLVEIYQLALSLTPKQVKCLAGLSGR